VDEIDLIVDRIKDHLPEYLPSPSKQIDDDQTVEVEQEAETQTETQAELEVQEHSEDGTVKLDDISYWKFKHYDSFAKALKCVKSIRLFNVDNGMFSSYDTPCPVFPLSSYLATNEKWKEFSTIFEGIDISMNILEWGNKDTTHISFLGEHRPDFHHLLIDDTKVTLLPIKETSTVIDKPNYYNLTLGYIDASKKPPPPNIMLKILKVKFLNGESQYSAEEIELLKKWFKSCGIEKLKKLYLERIISGQALKTSRYKNSPLQKLFSSAY